jgi:hypothetical protein
VTTPKITNKFRPAYNTGENRSNDLEHVNNNSGYENNIENRSNDPEYVNNNSRYENNINTYFGGKRNTRKRVIKKRKMSLHRHRS